MTAAWFAEQKTVQPRASIKVTIKRDGLPMTFSEVITGWRKDAEFRAFYVATLAAVPYPAYFWEMPPICRGQTDITYEFMLIRSDTLARMPPDADAFAAKFPTPTKSVATFSNLSGDAVLVAPKQMAAPSAYAHLAAFVRSAPAIQQHALFESLGDAIEGFLEEYDGRVWISTSGLGIAWLHIRLDTVPKYYQHQPYAGL